MKKSEIAITIKEGFKGQYHVTVNGKRYTAYGRETIAKRVSKVLMENLDNCWGDSNTDEE